MKFATIRTSSITVHTFADEDGYSYSWTISYRSADGKESWQTTVKNINDPTREISVNKHIPFNINNPEISLSDIRKYGILK